MMTTLALATALGGAVLGTPLSPQAETTDLSRVFKKGQVYNYQLRSHLQIEQRSDNLDTFIPEDVDINYDFSYKVDEVKPSGFAMITYTRPTLTQILGETADRPPVVEKIPVNFRLAMEISPINEVISLKDLNPPAKEKSLRAHRLNIALAAAPMAPVAQSILQEWAGELQRLALFIGSLDTAMDFNPKLPYEEAKVGESWKRTMSYQPQVIKGEGGRQAVQRLDLEYTYGGIVEVNGKKFHRVTAKMNLDTDAAGYINQQMGTKPEESGVSKIPLKLQSEISFDLDLQNRAPVTSTARTTGGWSLTLYGQSQAVVEEKIKGRVTMKLTSLK